MFTKAIKRARMRAYENVTYRLRDAEGNPKPMWADNALNRLVLRAARALANDPIDERGHVRPGILNHLAAYGLRVPFVTGQWMRAVTVANLVTDAGKAGVASRINGAGSEAAFTYIAIGAGTTAAAAGDTALQTEITTGGGARASATASRTTTDVTNDTARLVVTFSFSASFAVTESGVLNASSSGVLLCRQVFSAINVASGDSLQVTWDVDVD